MVRVNTIAISACSLKGVRARRALANCLALLCGQPIAEAHSHLLHASNAANASRQIGA